jgi:hypothetical protein
LRGVSLDLMHDVAFLSDTTRSCVQPMAPRRRAARPAGDSGVDLCEILYVNFPEFTFSGNTVNKGNLLQVVAERELRLRVRLLVHLEGERAGVFWYLFPLVVVAASPVGLHPHPVHPIETRRSYSEYREC